MIWGLAAVLVAAAMVGAVLGAFGAGSHRPTTIAVVNFAAGAFAALALVHLLPESAERSGWLIALLGGGAGVGLCAALARWAGGFCPACAVGHSQEVSLRPGLPLLIVVAFHSGLDGLAITGTSTPVRGVSLLFLAVLLHKMPEGLAVAAVSRGTGQSIPRALGITGSVELCTLLGVLLGLSLGAAGATVLGPALGVTAGSFLYLAFITFVGDREARFPALNAGSAAAGALLILGGRILVGAGP